MLDSSMSSPCVIGVVSPSDIPTLDNHSDPYVNTSIFDDPNGHLDAPPVLTRAPILQIPVNDRDSQHKIGVNGSQSVYPKAMKSFFLENIIAMKPTTDPNKKTMRKRNLFRIDDILEHICAAKEPKLETDDQYSKGQEVTLEPQIRREDFQSTKQEELIDPPSPSEVPCINSDTAHSVAPDSMPLLIAVDPPSLTEMYLQKTAEKVSPNTNGRMEISTDPTDVTDVDTLPCLESIENRPATPLTPSLDPEFLRRLEQEDMPKRVLRPSTTALTHNSKIGVLKKRGKAGQKTNNSNNNNNSPRERNAEAKVKKGTKKSPKKSNEVTTNKLVYAPIEVKISEEMTSVCPPSSSGLGSASSASSYGSQRSRGGRRRRTPKLVISNWKPVCSGSRQYVYFNNDALPVKRLCYTTVRHVREPETLHVRDSVVVKALDGTFNYGKVTRIFLDEDTGSLMATVLWYYNKTQIETDPSAIYPPVHDKELFASRHIDVVSLDTIEEIIFVVTFNEFARYMAENKIDSLLREQRPKEEDELWSRGEEGYPRRWLLPCEDTPIELVHFCHRLYDFKQKKISSNKQITSRKLLAARRSSHRHAS